LSSETVSCPAISMIPSRRSVEKAPRIIRFSSSSMARSSPRMRIGTADSEQRSSASPPSRSRSGLTRCASQAASSGVRGCGGQGVLSVRADQQQPAQPPERVADTVVLLVAAVLVELAGDEPAAVRGDDRAQLRGQRRLADAGHAAEQHPAAPARHDVGERLAQVGDLLVPPDQVGRRQRPRRDVMPAGTGDPAATAQLGQVVLQPVRALVTVVRLLLQQVQEDAGQLGRHLRVQR
jgi:hypothetical protein